MYQSEYIYIKWKIYYIIDRLSTERIEENKKIKEKKREKLSVWNDIQRISFLTHINYDTVYLENRTRKTNTKYK